jgi:hypothetical protein
MTYSFKIPHLETAFARAVSCHGSYVGSAVVNGNITCSYLFLAFDGNDCSVLT